MKEGMTNTTAMDERVPRRRNSGGDVGVSCICARRLRTPGTAVSRTRTPCLGERGRVFVSGQPLCPSRAHQRRGEERGRSEVGGTRPTAEFPDLFTISVGLRGLEPRWGDSKGDKRRTGVCSRRLLSRRTGVAL